VGIATSRQWQHEPPCTCTVVISAVILFLGYRVGGARDVCEVASSVLVFLSESRTKVATAVRLQLNFKKRKEKRRRTGEKNREGDGRVTRERDEGKLEFSECIHLYCIPLG